MPGTTAPLVTGTGSQAAPQPMTPSVTPSSAEPSVTFTSPLTNARAFRGALDFGPLPITFRMADITGEPLIIMARGRRSRVIRAELLVELIRTHPQYPVELEATSTPDLVAYVRYDGQGIAHLTSGEDLGPVPGVIIIPVRAGEPAPTTISIWDDSGTEMDTLSTTDCTPEFVCLLNGLPGR